MVSIYCRDRYRGLKLVQFSYTADTPQLFNIILAYKRYDRKDIPREKG